MPKSEAERFSNEKKTTFQAALHLGRRLRFLRAQLGVTQHELAERASISRPLISALENGKTALPRYLTLVRLAASLEVDVADLVRHPPPNRKRRM